MRNLEGGTRFDKHLSMGQPVKSIMYCQHIMTLDDSHPDSRSNGGVHASTRGADIHDGYIDVAL